MFCFHQITLNHLMVSTRMISWYLHRHLIFINSKAIEICICQILQQLRHNPIRWYVIFELVHWEIECKYSDSYYCLLSRIKNRTILVILCDIPQLHLQLPNSLQQLFSRLNNTWVNQYILFFTNYTIYFFF